jgi:signal transduction histidine kinase/ligand-binding sensor domain-containing protein
MAISTVAQFNFEITFQDMDKAGLLPNNFINDMVMDDLGILWIATNDGLCRYDSPNNIQVFNKENTSLESNLINVLENGSDSTLWIGSTFGGLTNYNYNTHQSKTYLNSGAAKLSNSEILALKEINKKEVWIGSEAGLDILYPEKDSIYNVNQPSDPFGVIGGPVLDIFVDDKGWTWITTWSHGIYLYIPHSSGRVDKASFRQILIPKLNGSSNIWEIVQQDSQHYWLATHNGGLGYMSIPDDASLTRQDWDPSYRFYTTEETSLSLNYITDIEHDRDGNLWIATNNGLNILTQEHINAIDWEQSIEESDIEFVTYYHRPQIKTSINDNNITSLYHDKQGLVWIGSSSGINQYNELNNRFTPVLLSDLVDDNDASNDRVSVMAMIDDSTLLIGTSEHGFIGYNIYRDVAVPLPPFATTINRRRITALHRYNDFLYIGTDTGVFRISLSDSTEQIIEYDLIGGSELTKQEQSSFFITTLLKDSQGRLWAGSEIALFMIDESTGGWTRSDYDAGITKVFEDSNENVWFTSYRGITCIRPGDSLDEMVIYLKGEGGEHLDAITSNQVVNVAEYNKQIYFGSVNGLFKYDLASQQFTDFNDKSIQNVVNNLTITERGILWTSSSDGILRYDLKNNSLKMYAERDGIHLSSIRSDACINGPNDQVFVGCHGGFLKLDESDWSQTVVPAEVFVTDIRTTNERGELKVHRGINADEIVITSDNLSVELGFMCNNYSHPRHNTFAYHLKGFEGEEWNYTNDEKVTYTNLDPGTYEFQVKVADVDGNWPEGYKSIKLIVEAKIVETTLFKFLVLLGTALLIYLLVRYYIRSTRERYALLEEYNQSLEKRDAKMQELVTQLDQSNQDLTRSNQELAQYAYITSHDLQEPLRTVGAFAGLLSHKAQQLNEPELNEISGFIENGVIRMSSLIKSLLNYSLLDKDTDHLESVDLNTLVKGKILGLNEYIRQHNAEVVFDELPTIICLEEQIGTVFYNLILNGLKFNNSDKPTVKINAEDLDEHWQFKVTDNGIGIPYEYQKKIFAIFTRLHRKEEYEGTGIGLAVCNKIVNNHQGNITLSSQEGQGSTFAFTVSKHLRAKKK